MADLFTPNTTEVSKENPSASLVPLKKGDNKSKSLFKVYYKGKGGKFSDKESARVAAIEKENKRLTVNCTYWKRQAERLSADYFTEHDKVKVLEEKLKLLTNNQCYAEKSHTQQEGISSTNKSSKHGVLSCQGN